MTFSKYQDKSKPLFQSPKILDIHELNMYLIALFMYSYFILAKYFNDYFTLNKNIHSRDTHSASNISVGESGGYLSSREWLLIINIATALNS